jgi:hypothetical protein
MDVADWLRALGLERYESAFRENDVEAGLLANLTADDLRDLGITSVGHRRRILEAIAALRLEATPAGDPVRFSPPPSTSPTESLADCSLHGLCGWDAHSEVGDNDPISDWRASRIKHVSIGFESNVQYAIRGPVG